MLQRQEVEHLIIEIPLKKKKSMEVTNLKLSVFDSKSVKLSIPIQNIRSIAPLKKDKIRIQYVETQDLGYGPVSKRKFIDYDMDKPEVSALQICHKIKNEHERLNTWGKNDKGLLLLQPQEHIVISYNDIKTSQGTGLLYITNVGLALETDEGIAFDVPYEKISLVTDHKKDKIRVLWSDAAHFQRHSFDFKMPKKLDRNTSSSLIRKEFGDWRKKNGWAFVQLQKKFENLSYDEMYNLAKIENPEFKEYLALHVNHTFGFSSLLFSSDDSHLILSCKLAGLDVNIIKDISPEELQQRKESKQYFAAAGKIEREIKLHKDELDRLEKNCDGADDFKELKKSKDYKNHQKVIERLEQSPEMINQDSIIDKIVANTFQSFDKKNRIIYDEWCKDHPLENFADKYDDKWIHYLLEKLNTVQGHNPIGGMALSCDILSDRLKLRDRNRTTLENFAAPDGVLPEYVWNNCWYDAKHKIYYVQDDNLSEKLQNKADSDPDHAQTMIGRRVWGFAEDQVEMFCGFPSIKHDSEVDDYEYHVTTVRKTGKLLDETLYKIRDYILPILKEEDFTEELALQFGKLGYQSNQITCFLTPSGYFNWASPRLQELYGKGFSFAEIPLNEMVRRALFAVECHGWFDVQEPLSLD